MTSPSQIHGDELRTIRETLVRFGDKLGTLADLQASQATEQKLHGERLTNINDHLRALNGRTAKNEAIGGANAAMLNAHQYKIEASEKDRSILWKKLSALELMLHTKVAALDVVLGELRTSMAVAMATAKGVVQGATTAGKAVWVALGAAGGLGAAVATAAAVWAAMK